PFALGPIILPLGVDLKINLLFVIKLRLAGSCLRSQFPRDLMIIYGLVEIADQPAVMLSCSEFYRVAMIALRSRFDGASQVVGQASCFNLFKCAGAMLV